MTDTIISEHSKKLIRILLGKDMVRFRDSHGHFYVKVKSGSILKSLSILHSHPELEFSSLSDCFVVDFTQERGVYTIYYMITSYKLGASVFISADTREIDSLQSVTILFPNADWFEREAFDMFGIRFNDHPDLRRILNTDSFHGFPMRKQNANS